MADDRQHDRACAPTCGRCPSVKRGADARGPGRSRGGPSTKIHAARDPLGSPVRPIAGPGQHSDIACAADPIDGFAPGAVLGDKGYDADHLCAAIGKTGATVVIPPGRNRKAPRPRDRHLYKERDQIERFNKLRQCRRVATRYDKLLVNFMGFVKLAAIAICPGW